MSGFGSVPWGGVGAGSIPSGVPVKNLFYMALRKANVTLRPGVGPSPDQLADCLQEGQLMISQAQIKRLMIFTINIADYPLGTGEVYTMGPGGTLKTAAGVSAPRPVKIERAKLILQTGTPVYLEIFQGTFREFADLALQKIPGALPQFLYCDYNYPLANVYLVPQDRGGDILELYTWSPIPTLSTVNDLILWPPGYDDWFVNNLAVRLASIFKSQGAEVTDDTRMEASRSQRAITSKNGGGPRLINDAPKSAAKGGTFNYFDGLPGS